jgi:long-chain acyl-CoA synthetase
MPAGNRAACSLQWPDRGNAAATLHEDRAMSQVETVNEALLKVAGRGDAVVWRWQDAGEWKPITAAEIYGRVRALAAALSAWGVRKGDRVALLSENRWEWPVTDFAVLALGAVDVPLYLTLTVEQVGYMLRDSAAKVAVVSNREQYEKVIAAGDLPELRKIVVMDGWDQRASYQQKAVVGNDDVSVSSMRDLMAGAEALQAHDAGFDASLREVRPDDLATIIYTSGTTGEPKGVMLTHGNLACNFSLSTKPFGFNETDTCISFLPLSHVTARHLDYALMCDGSTLAYCPKFDQLAAAMKAVQPTILVAVPRVYEKIRHGVEGKSHGVKKRIFKWAQGAGNKHRDETLSGKQPNTHAWIWPAFWGAFTVWECIRSYRHRHPIFLVGFLLLFALVAWGSQREFVWMLADKLVFSKIREAFGGRVKTFVSGGAPLGMDTAGWFADVGIRILEGYGLTETSPVIALNTPQRSRIGTVGPVLANVQVRFAPDGELEVRGPSVFQGYWNKPQETAETFTEDGWLKTGDIGNLDADGFLSITDRKKELLKTSGGKLIAPQPIENKLKAHALVSSAALVGDKHKFACVLISPNFAVLEGWAKVHGITAIDHHTLVNDVQVVARYQRIVDEVNGTLAPFESIKRVALVSDEWSVETDELTPSLKLKRRVVEQKYAAEIADFYKDEATAAK